MVVESIAALQPYRETIQFLELLTAAHAHGAGIYVTF
ncbi:hypothetical protein ACVWWW_001876 [Lysobacter sp. HA18]